MKTETLVLLGVVAVGAFLLTRSSGGGGNAANPQPQAVQPGKESANKTTGKNGWDVLGDLTEWGAKVWIANSGGQDTGAGTGTKLV